VTAKLERGAVRDLCEPESGTLHLFFQVKCVVNSIVDEVLNGTFTQTQSLRTPFAIPSLVDTAFYSRERRPPNRYSNRPVAVALSI
jgi:hypothetical protein